MNLKATGYECNYEGYIYNFQWLSHCNRWMVLRRKEENINIPPYIEALNEIDGQLQWESILTENRHCKRALYENETYASADVEAIAAGHRPAILTSN